MSKISQVNVKAARDNPESQFDTPSEVVDAIGLTRVEKLAVLERWLDQVQQRMDAANEGMPATDATEADIALEERIRQALQDLHETHAEG